MTSIFECPMIFNGKDEYVVLIYDDYIVWKITNLVANFCIEDFKNGRFEPSSYDEVIKITDIYDYEYNSRKDSFIKFGVLKDDKKSHHVIYFEDIEETKKAEKSFEKQLENLGFTREEKKLTALRAAGTPGLVLGIITFVSALFTWFVYILQTFEPQHNLNIKWYSYIFYKLSKTIGYLPLLLFTILLIGITLYWIIKKMTNPTFKVKAVKGIKKSKLI